MYYSQQYPLNLILGFKVSSSDNSFQYSESKIRKLFYREIPIENQIKSNQIKSFISAEKNNIYEFNFYKSQYVKYYFPQPVAVLAEPPC